MPTVPSTIGEELRYNVFMRCTSAEEMLRIRGGKDNFNPGRPYAGGEQIDKDFIKMAMA